MDTHTQLLLAVTAAAASVQMFVKTSGNESRPFLSSGETDSSQSTSSLLPGFTSFSRPLSCSGTAGGEVLMLLIMGWKSRFVHRSAVMSLKSEAASLGASSRAETV